MNELKTPHSAIKPINSAIDELVNNLGIRKKLREYDAVLCWENAVGEHIAKMATAIRITQGVLFVNVKTSTWRNELMLCKKDIIEKLNIAVGETVVKDIKFK